jgi:hypothetical protein
MSLHDLKKRVDAATGPDRELDYALLMATLPKGHAYIWDPDSGHEYTASLDAALALVNKVFPHTMWCLYAMEFPGCKLLIPDNERNDYVGSVEVEADGFTPNLAILSALLTALIAKENPDV